MMKKYLVGLLFLGALSCDIFADSGARVCSTCDCEYSSRSYLFVRPLFQSVSPEMVSGFRYDRPHIREDGYEGSVQAVFFGSKSTNDCDLARYFFPFCKNELIVDEREQDPELLPGGLDLLAAHFNIFTIDGDFRSKISIKPQQSVIGLGLHLRQSFWKNEERGRGFWASVSFPIQRVKNNLNFCERVINDGGGPDETAADVVVANMKDAVVQRDWNFGLICPCPMTETKVADIEFKLGYEWLDHDPCHLESYIGFLVPTGNKPDPTFLFSPVVGHGHHWGTMFGGAFGVQIWASKNHPNRYLRVENTNNSQYLFSNVQCRSIDLFCRPWTRYIEVYRNKAQAEEAAALGSSTLATPGINVLTLPVKVTPGFSHNNTTAIVLTAGGFQGELGYNFFCRRAECIELECPFPTGENAPAIKHDLGEGQTNPVRDITGNRFLENITTDISLANYEENVITRCDLDLLSAASPCVLSHTFYAALGYRWDERNYPIFINAGGSGEFSNSNNAVVERWVIWGKVGFSY